MRATCGPARAPIWQLLNMDVATLLRADDALADVRAELTYVGGREVHRA